MSDYSKGLADGAKAERERIGAILRAPEAAQRSTLAGHLAFATSESATSAIGMLRAARRDNGGKIITSEPAGWDDVTAKLNAEHERYATGRVPGALAQAEGHSSPPASDAPAPWSAVMADVTAEAGGGH